MFESRSSERYEFSDHKVEYSFSPFSGEETFEADLINCSETGLCMLSLHHLTIGQKITLKNFMTYSFRTAEVIWIEKDEGTGFGESNQVSFKVGLQFTD